MGTAGVYYVFVRLGNHLHCLQPPIAAVVVYR